MDTRRHVIRGFRASALSWIALSVFPLAGCVELPRPPAARTTPEIVHQVTHPGYPPAYTAAISDALDPRQSEVVQNLIPIVPENEYLHWREIDGVAQVRMVTLTGSPQYYQSSVGGDYDTGSHYLWATAVPEVQELCGQFSDAERLMRLRQLLGLTPDAVITDFVELWVQPQDLFRPAADSEITDRTAGLVMPADVPDWYRTWFNQLRAVQYFHSWDPDHQAYPWTMLGYTYDWGGDEASGHQGASEFVIRAGATVQVIDIVAIPSYCRFR